MMSYLVVLTSFVAGIFVGRFIIWKLSDGENCTSKNKKHKWETVSAISFAHEPMGHYHECVHCGKRRFHRPHFGTSMCYNSNYVDWEWVNGLSGKQNNGLPRLPR